MQTKRPLGVTIIAVLMIIGGILSIIGGIILLIFGIGIFLILLGIASLVIAWGLLKAKRWAWILTVIISIITIIYSIVGIATGRFDSVINLILYGIILYYLFRPDVKAYFGKTKIST
jgi:hypothetical protein